MNGHKNVLLLVGSPRGHKSVSFSLGNYLLDLLAKKEFRTEIIYPHRMIYSVKGLAALFQSVENADILILASPLYVDSAPAPVIKTMELIHSHRSAFPGNKPIRFLAISNCGFPESLHNATVSAIYRHFASESGFLWAGCLTVGEGGSLNGKPLEKAGSVAQTIRKALDLTAVSLAEGRNVPPEAEVLLSKPFMPVWLYTRIGNMMFKWEARKNGVRDQMNNRPYEERKR
jgi:hypothetical protein